MMLHTKSPRHSLLKLLVFLPIIAVTLVVNAETVTDYVYNEPQTPIKKGNKAGTINLGAGKTIVVEKADDAKAEAAQSSDLEQFTISGTVYDGSAATKTPIVGAVVKIAGSNKGTVTDKEGNFRLEVTTGDRIEVMYVGFESFTIGVSKIFSERFDYKIMLRKEGTDPSKPYDVVEQMPQFPGGHGKLFEYLSMNVRYPKEAEDAGVQGRVIVTFVVEKDGCITGAKIFRSVDPALDAEALRVINGMPNWTPGKQNGEPVRVKYTVPVTFRIHGGPNIPADNEKHANALPETVVVGYGNETAQGLWTPGENGPCVIIDGKTVDGAKLKDIDPKTIESMDIIKGKSAVEKYGDKAKHGAILINTKNKK